jgi:hypothetical protein
MAGAFVVIDCPSQRQFFGVVTGPNLNLNRNSLQPYDNTQINQMEQIASGRMAYTVAINEVYYYEIELLAQIVDRKPQSVSIRSRTGSQVRHATADEIMLYLGMPPVMSRTQIGSLINTDIPVCVSRKLLLLHTLVAGATGSGKTNTIGGITKAAIELDMAVLIFDHKPDYQNTNEANDELPRADYYKPLTEQLTFWYIGDPMPMDGRSEKRLSVAGMDLAPHLLAPTMFHWDTENQQQESFLTLLETFIGSQNGRPWSLRVEFAEWLSHQTPAMPPQTNEKVLDAIKRKFARRIPKWVESETAPRPQTGPFAGQRGPAGNFDLSGIRARDAIVIRVGESGRDYGLLLSYILGRIDRQAALHQLGCRVLVVIDEAQDIFSADRTLRAAVEVNLDKHVRKGRSLGIGYLIGVQSADAVPDQMMNNLNSRIIHGHKSVEQLRKASSRLTDEQRQLAVTLRPGEALADFHCAMSLAHCQMRRSPFRLTKDDNE